MVKAFIAGVQPNSVDISLTRESLTISGQRSDEKEVEEDGYFQRELYWGSVLAHHFITRRNCDVDAAEASRKARHPDDTFAEDQQAAPDQIESAESLESEAVDVEGIFALRTCRRDSAKDAGTRNFGGRVFDEAAGRAGKTPRRGPG